MRSFKKSLLRKVLVTGCCLSLTACMGPQITRTQDLAPEADAPYENILLITLFTSFEARRNFEQELAEQLTAKGIKATSSIPMLKTTTPMNRDTVITLLEQSPADSVLVTHVASLDSEMNLKAQNPETTRNIEPTRYFNVYSVEVTEYIEPPSLEVESELVLVTQMFSTAQEKAVWAIESKATIVQDVSVPGHREFIEKESKAIVRHLSRDGLIAP